MNCRAVGLFANMTVMQFRLIETKYIKSQRAEVQVIIGKTVNLCNEFTFKI